MKFQLKNNLTHKTEYILKRAGYFFIFDKLSNQGSFIRKLNTGRYPRFHLYVSEDIDNIIFDLHLDQAKTRYSGQKAHRADYESEEVKSELTRIYHIIKEFIPLEK